MRRKNISSLSYHLSALLFIGTTLVADEPKLKLPEFKPAAPLPEFKKMEGPRGFKAITGPPAIEAMPEMPAIRHEKQKRSPRALQSGDTIPNVTLTDPDGNAVNLPRHIHGQHALIIFYRGGWSPYCKRHLKSIKTIEKQVLGLGYRIIAISPDRPKQLLKTIKELKPEYELLSDSSMLAAEAFGIAFTVDDETIETYKGYKIDLEEQSGKTHHQLPHPSVYLVSPGGIIRYSRSNEDFKIRINADELLKQANAHYRPVF